jgi:hypothetical protein
VQLTSGSLRVFEHFAWLEVGSGKAASSPPAHQRVTLAVSPLVADREKQKRIEMNTIRHNVLHNALSKSIYLVLVVVMGVTACATLPQTPLPFSFVSELPKNEFLFVHVYDDDYTCIEGFCGCAVSEGPAKPFELIDGKLRINEHFLEPVPVNWASLRKSNNLVALYSDWSQWTAQLQTFSSFPITTPAGGFSILGVNPQGDIQIMIDNEYVIISAGAYYTHSNKQPDEIDNTCKVLHEYTLYNYGLIKDENVEFTGGGCCEP